MNKKEGVVTVKAEEKEEDEDRVGSERVHELAALPIR